MADETYVSQIISEVESKVDQVFSRADTLISSFTSAANALASVPLPTLPPLPTLADPGTNYGATLSLPTLPSAPSAPSINMNLPAVPAAPDITDLDAIISSLPAFNPSITTIAIPTAPAAIDTSGAPSRPGITTSVPLPVAPDLSAPSLGPMLPITIPTFTFPTLPTFDTTAPAFTATAPGAVAAWSEAVYASEELESIQARVALMLNGSSGLPPAVEEALFGRARSRDDIAALKAVQDAYETFAGRGFSMPPGMLVKQVNATIEDNQLKAQATSREIYVNANKILIEQLNTAVQQGIALEGLLSNLANNTLARQFEMEKFRLEQAISLYNAQVQEFNIRSQAYSVAATVYRTRIDAALSAVQAYKVQVDAQQAISGINNQTVQIFQAQLQALATRADVYKTSLEAVQTQLGFARTQIDIYKADIDAYATRINADKTRFEAYDIQVRGEASKVGILEAETRAFAARVQAQSTVGELGVAKVQARIAAAGQATQVYASQVQAERDKAATTAQSFSAQAQMFVSQSQAIMAQAGVGVSIKELDIKNTEATLRANIARYEAEYKKFDGEATRQIKLSELNIGSLRSLAQYSATLASGAMSAVNLGLQAQGQAQAQWSDSTQKTYSYT